MDKTVTFIACYLACHLLAYAVVLRRIPYFRTETGIFLAHAVSYLALLFAVVAQSVAGRGGAHTAGPHLALALSLHGIYSLSFLELWSLTQGSFSLSILDRVAGARAPVTFEDIARLGEIGAVKRSARNGGLLSLGLLRQAPGGGVKLTAAGSACARLVQLLLWLAGGRALNR
jgi:hypothetical protein